MSKKFLVDILAKAGLIVEGTTDLQGTATAVTQALSDSSTKIATTAFVKGQGYVVGNVYSTDGSLSGNRTITLNGSYFDIAGTTKTRFFANGNVVIDGANPVDAGFKFDVNGTVRVTSFLTVGSDAASATVIKGPSSDGSIFIGGSSMTTSIAALRNIIVSTVGSYSTLTGINNTFYGRAAGLNVTTGASNVFIGSNAGAGITTGARNVFVTSSDAGNLPSSLSNSIHLVAGNGYKGNDASSIPSGTHAFFGGGFNTGFAVKDFYFGQMPFTADAGGGLVNIVFYAPSGLGTDIGGANFTLAAGRGTGAGTPGDFIIRTSNTTTTGSTLQTLADRIRVAGGTGVVTIATLAGTGDRMVVANSSGVLSTQAIPSLSGYVPTSRIITINGTAYDLSADRAWTVSANQNARTEYEFTTNGSTATYSAVYSVGQVDVFYNGSKLSSTEFTASNGTSVTLGFTPPSGQLVEVVAWETGGGVTNGRTLTINGVAYDLSANRSWTIDNASLGAQAQLNGTGFVKISGTTISYDNSTYLTTASAASTYLTISTAASTYLTTSSAASTYLAKSGGTLTGALTGTSASFTGFAINANPTSAGTGATFTRYLNTSGDFYMGIENSTSSFFGASAYANVMYMGSTNLEMFWSGSRKVTINNTGAATFSGSISTSGSLSTTGFLNYNSGDGNDWFINPAANGPTIRLKYHGGSTNRSGALGWIDNGGNRYDALSWQDQSVTFNGTATLPRALGKSYAQTSGGGSGTANVDTGITYNTGDFGGYGRGATYEVVVGANPNAGGSGGYYSQYMGILMVYTGWSGSAVTTYITYTSLAAANGGGNLTITPVFWNGSSESSGVGVYSTGSQIRIKVSGYNSSFTGQDQFVYLKRIS